MKPGPKKRKDTIRKDFLIFKNQAKAISVMAKARNTSESDILRILIDAYFLHNPVA